LLNFDKNIGDTTPVGSHPEGASWCGALDMAGNVYEWVGDWYGRYYVIREAYRDYTVPSGHGFNLGFRCVVSP
jgi:formylglycine-generating enzyme required for sulfatase activity